MEKNIHELSLSRCAITYAFETGNPGEIVEEQTFSVPLPSFSELKPMLDEKRIKKMAEEKGVKRVFPDSLSLVFESEDGKIRVEALLGADFSVAELIQEQ